ncbi:MAG TPA: hypothetical protein VNV85_04890 [Puia sp.]|jgi:hypothetical protein|nr:hypothetical protein [Puia sp.]
MPNASYREKRDKQNEKLNELHASLTENQVYFEKDKKSLRMSTIVVKTEKPVKKIKKK